MSELTSLPSSDQALALEYVVGTLRGSERRAFVKALSNSPELQTMVAAWEETLMALPALTPMPAPADTWGNIEAALNRMKPLAVKSRFVQRYIPWVAGIAALCLLTLGVLFTSEKLATPGQQWRASYVAVLTDEEGQVQLTALTQSQGEPPNAKNQLRLQSSRALAGTARELWAVAAKDGSVQSLLVFGSDTTEPMVLSKAQWAAIKEAKELLLTEKSSDGNPPGRVLAKGPCVQLAQPSAPAG